MSLQYSVFHGIRSIKIEESEIDLPIQGLETHTVCSCVVCQSPCFPENHDFHFLCLHNVFLFEGQICEAFICLEYRI